MCKTIFRTTDAEHPGVQMVMAQKEVNLAGPVKVLSESTFPTEFAGVYQRPAESRKMFEERRAEIEAVIRDVEAVLPKVRNVIADSEFGQEALQKADAALLRAKGAIETRSLDVLESAYEPLERTLKMLRGVGQKMGVL